MVQGGDFDDAGSEVHIFPVGYSFRSRVRISKHGTASTTIDGLYCAITNPASVEDGKIYRFRIEKTRSDRQDYAAKAIEEVGERV